jgi:hypothetical protein
MMSILLLEFQQQIFFGPAVAQLGACRIQEGNVGRPRFSPGLVFAPGAGWED